MQGIYSIEKSKQSQPRLEPPDYPPSPLLFPVIQSGPTPFCKDRNHVPVFEHNLTCDKYTHTASDKEPNSCE